MQIDDLPCGLYTAAGVRTLDDIAINDFGIPGITLMRRAAEAVVATLMARFPDCRSVTVYCGSGNNAGDGYIVAGLLAERGVQVSVQTVGDTAKLGPDAARALDYCRRSAARFVAGAIEPAAMGDVVIDALLGTGLSGAVRPAFLAAIDQINHCARPVVSVDIPSGLCADTGQVLGAAVKATTTVTFIGVKQGLLTQDGPEQTGELVFASLDVPAEVFERVQPNATRLTLKPLLAGLGRRERGAHKNRFGHVLIVGGDEGMGGAVAMSAEAALRSGSGLVSVATHPSHAGVLLSRRPELMVRGMTGDESLVPLLARASVIVLGPGLGQSAWSRSIWQSVMQATEDGRRPLVMDADALNLLSLEPQRRTHWVLTPHPGEAIRLLGNSLPAENRFDAVRSLQSRYGGVVVLKGAGSLVGDGKTLGLCSAGNPGMATAGMGDVLAGVIGGLLAQGLEAGAATRLAVQVHAMAGDLAAGALGERGLIATDLIPWIRQLLNPSRG